MNTPGNALFNATVNGAVSANTIVGSVGNYGALFLFIGVLLLLILAYMLYTQRTSIAELIPGLPPVDWRDIERRERREERRERREERREERRGESWCFVGEDVTGRWCVRVPRPDACSPERLFDSRPACELVPASPLPLGIIADGGANMIPLAVRPSLLNKQLIAK